MIRPFLGKTPTFDASNFIAPSADVIGDVVLGSNSSVWFNVTIRGDVNYIRIGEESNVQDNSVVHVTNKTAPTVIGDRVTIGHRGLVHGCTIHNDVLIGMGSIVMDHAVIGSHSIVGAGTLITTGVKIPPRSLVLGSPGKVVRSLTDEEVDRIGRFASNYVKYSRVYLGIDAPETNPFYEPEDAS